MKLMADYKNIRDMIDESNSILITSHYSGDGDAVGSQLAMFNYLKQLGKNVEIYDEGEISFQYKFLPGFSNIKDISEATGENKFDLAIVLDSSNLDRIGKVKELLDSQTKIINIDHHPDDDHFGDLNLVVQSASSTAEILTQMFFDIGFEIDKDTATVLYAAILTDTGRFRYESTGRRTMELAGLLIERGAAPRKICDSIYFANSPGMTRLTGKVLNNAEFIADGKVCMLEITNQLLKEYDCNLEDFVGMAAYTLTTKDAVVGALFKELPGGKTEVSLRSKNILNVSNVAHLYGGGGHCNAAGFVVDMQLKDIRLKVMDNLKGLVNASV